MLKIKNILKGINQRIYYVKNFKKGFNIFFLLPGSLRTKIDENLFFKKLTGKIDSIKLKRISNTRTLLKAGKFEFIFPNRCFYEGDFFDIIYPNLGLKNDFIETTVYKNPYYESEGCYENFECKLEKGDYVIDAGANIGLFSIVASKIVSDNGKIFAFEPMDEITNILKENIEKNNCKNIVTEKKLLGEKRDTVEFYYNLEKNYNASSSVIKGEGDSVLKLEQITLDDYVELNKIERVDFIKADIEGSERNLLKGAENTIKKFSPKLSIRTYHLPDDKEVLFKIVKDFNPKYNIVLHKKTLYAWI